MSHTLPPRRLFKYRSVVSPYTEDIFRSRRLFFSAPAAFNDPFDCNLPLIFEGTEQEWSTFLNEFITPGPDIQEVQRKQAVSNLMAQRPWENPGPFQFILEENRVKVRNQSSVFCWASKPDDVLMFAYYADSHKGICLEFEVGLEHEIGRAVPVIYPPEFPDLNYMRVHSDISNILIFRKAPFWAHESELRVFRYGVAAGMVGFPDHLLKRVIFGAEAGDKAINLVKTWCTDWKSRLVFARAKPRADGFALTVEDFDEVTPLSNPS